MAVAWARALKFVFISGVDKELEQSLNEGLGIINAQASLRVNL